MAKKRGAGFWVFTGIIGFVVLLLVASLIFVIVSVCSLDNSLEKQKKDVIAAFDEREKVTDKLVNMLESKMPEDSEPFKKLESANDELKKANTVSELTNANFNVDVAIDQLVYVMRDKYLYLESEKVMDVITEIDSARSHIVLESTEYNGTADDYNYAVDNFPGNCFASIFGYEKVDKFKVIEYEDLTY